MGGVLVVLLAVPLLLVMCVCRPRSVSSRQGEKERGGRRNGAVASEHSANQVNGVDIELTSLTPTTAIGPVREQDAYIPPHPASGISEETSGLNFRLPS